VLLNWKATGERITEQKSLPLGSIWTTVHSICGSVKSEYMNWRVHLSKGPNHAKLSSALQSSGKHISHV